MLKSASGARADISESFTSAISEQQVGDSGDLSTLSSRKASLAAPPSPVGRYPFLCLSSLLQVQSIAVLLAAALTEFEVRIVTIVYRLCPAPCFYKPCKTFGTSNMRLSPAGPQSNYTTYERVMLNKPCKAAPTFVIHSRHVHHVLETHTSFKLILNL